MNNKPVLFSRTATQVSRAARLILLGLTLALPLQSRADYSWEQDLHHRLLLDFNKTRADVKAYIQRYIPNVTDSQLDRWEASRALETMTLDGEKRYFHNAAPNLFRIDPECAAIKARQTPAGLDEADLADSVNLPLIMQQANKSTHRLAQPKHVRVKYTLTVNADAVPEGEVIRCWLPFPHRSLKRHTGVKLLSASQPYTISPRSATHSTVYMEQRAVKGQPTVFTEEFELQPYGEYHAIRPENVRPYKTHSALYRRYTREEARHIRFTPRLRALADSLTAGITNPYLKARSIFTWINNHFPWASAREYSTIDNIPEYVVANGHGDCGQVSLLFITLCRLSGIPAHFQSGFTLHPGHCGMHDWAEAYFEGYGWVPVDQSFGIPTYADSEAERYFFLGGIDSWRLVVNQDYGDRLYPAKQYPRSETVDFQRGEVEWSGGNLYFDQWRWSIEPEYLSDGPETQR